MNFLKRWPNTCALVTVSLLFVVGIPVALRHLHNANEDMLVQDAISPVRLELKNNRERAEFTAKCVKEIPIGMMEGEKVTQADIDACGRLGYQLYPDRDWKTVAEKNRAEIEKIRGVN